VTNTLAYYTTEGIILVKRFIIQAAGAIIIKLFTGVIYRHSMEILSFSLTKLYCLGNYCVMAAYYCGILTLQEVLFYNIGPWIGIYTTSEV
jgi:hypothetical protein